MSRDGAAPAVKDGCRFHGSLTVNKVAGNFHITAGKYVFFALVDSLHILAHLRCDKITCDVTRAACYSQLSEASLVNLSELKIILLF